MPLHIIRNDITKVHCDAIVNAANTSLLGGGGVDGMIHRAAGPELLKECRTLGGCKTGQAKITNGYKLPCKYVIHTPGPVWQGGHSHERELLISCYYNSLLLAKEKNCKTIAFPLISSGVYGYPKEKALQVAADTITHFISEEAPDMIVYIVVFDKNSYLISESLYSDIRSFIDDQYVDDIHKDKDLFTNRQIINSDPASISFDEEMLSAPLPYSSSIIAEPPAKKKLFGQKKKSSDKSTGKSFVPMSEEQEHQDLSSILKNMDESFSEMLLRKIDEKGMRDSECYKKANIDRKLFSKIRSDKLYKPSKNTALAFAIALELPLEETKDMLQKAGFALSHSSKSDIIIEYFIVRQIYDIITINEALFSFDQKLLGA